MPDDHTTVHRSLLDGQTCVVCTVDIGSGAVTELYRTHELLLEAPNWTSSGALILNGNGVLWRLDCERGDLTRLSIAGLPDLNNDHVPAPDGDTMFVSGYDGHIHRVALSTASTARSPVTTPSVRCTTFSTGSIRTAPRSPSSGSSRERTARGVPPTSSRCPPTADRCTR